MSARAVVRIQAKPAPGFPRVAKELRSLSGETVGRIGWSGTRAVAFHLGVSMRVVSIHLHPPVGGRSMVAAMACEVVEDRGIVGNRRYFAKRRSNGEWSRRQVTLIEREQLASHAASLGLPGFDPGVVRSNLETEGIELVPLVGRRLEIGTAVLEITAPRDPCAKMDAIVPGLRRLMEANRQGVLARVVRSGAFLVGDPIRILPA
jgi:MOSC domain-containing protein YiiM